MIKNIMNLIIMVTIISMVMATLMMTCQIIILAINR